MNQLDDFDKVFPKNKWPEAVIFKGYVLSKLLATIKERDEFWKQRMWEFGEGLKTDDIDMSSAGFHYSNGTRGHGYNIRNMELNIQIDQELKKLL